MEYSGTNFTTRFNEVLSGDLSVVGCVFDGFVWSGSGGGGYVRGNFELSVCGSLFSNCESGEKGGGLCAKTSISNTTRTNFLLCRSSHHGLAFFQYGKNGNHFEQGSFHQCSSMTSDGNNYAAIMQYSGAAKMSFMNGSQLSSVGESADTTTGLVS